VEPNNISQAVTKKRMNLLKTPGLALKKAAKLLPGALQVTLAAMDKVVRMVVDPRMIRGHVVRNKIEHQLQSTFLHPFSQTCERRGSAEIAVYGVVLDGESGAGDVFFS
jgi:hypothetical protein